MLCAKVHSENQWIWIAKYAFFKQCMCNNHNLIICTLLKCVFRNSMLTYIFVNMFFFNRLSIIVLGETLLKRACLRNYFCPSYHG